MPDVQTLLPPNATATETTLEQTCARSLDDSVHTLWNPETIPLELLPWLAWALSVDVWDVSWTEARKRAVVAASVSTHRVKGTVGALKSALNALDQSISVTEWFDFGGAPFSFQIAMDVSASAVDAATLSSVFATIEAAKNARSKLNALSLDLTSSHGVFNAVAPAFSQIVQFGAKRAAMRLGFNGGASWIDNNPARLTSLLSTTRATTCYAPRSDDTLELFPANKPRITDLGLLVEESRTNLVLHSQDFTNAVWTEAPGGTGIAAVVTANAGIAPDGTMTADRLQCDLNGGTTTGDISTIAQSFSGLTNPHDSSAGVYIKSNTEANQEIWFSSALGIASQTVTVTSSWQRITDTALAIAFATDKLQLGLRGGLSPATDDTCDILIWGAQLEETPTLSSYIPTTTTSATRDADNISLVPSGILPFAGFNTTEGTIVIEFIVPAGAQAVNKTLFSINDGTTNKNISVFENAGGVLGGFVKDTTTQAVPLPTETFTEGIPSKFAFAWKANDFATVMDGGIQATDTAGTVPSGLTRMFLGHDINTNRQFVGLIKFLVFFPTSLST